MRKLTKVIGFGVLLGLALLIIKGFFHIPDSAFWKWYLIVFAAVILGVCFINGVYYTLSMKKIMKLAPILEKEQNPLKFIEENRKLQAKIKSTVVKELINLNLTAAYCDLGEFDTAMQILKGCNVKRLKGVNRVVYSINYTYLLFRLGQNQQALEAMEANSKCLKILKGIRYWAAT